MSDLYTQVTDRIIEQIQNGTPPWRRPWSSQSSGMPRNVVSQKQYRGINTFLLWHEADEKGYSSGLWGTYRQWQTLGGQVRRGERATKITFWKTWDQTTTDLETGEDREEKRFILREYSVFALEQCEGDELTRFQPPPKPKPEFIDFQPAEDVMAATGADIHHGGSRAFYDGENDLIVLPFKQCFDDSESYYSTALHELAHWSGHRDRLHRHDKLARYGDHSYAMEELVAEMSAAFLTASLGIPNTGWKSQSASYISGWLEVLKADSRAIITASSQASQAADYVLSFSDAARTSDEIVAQS